MNDFFQGPKYSEVSLEIILFLLEYNEHLLDLQEYF